MTERHSWGEPERPSPQRTLRTCARCGLLKLSRHERDEHWFEFWRGSDRIRADGGRTPACEPTPGMAEPACAR